MASVGYLQDAIPTGNADQKDLGCGEPDPQEREAASVRGPWQNIPADEQPTVDVEIFDLGTIVIVYVGEDCPKPIDTGPLSGAWDKEQDLRDVATQGSEEPLGAEGAEEMGQNRVDVAKQDRGVCRVDAVGAHLEARSRGEEDDPARGVDVKEVRRQEVGSREGIWHGIPVDLTPTIGE